MKDIYGLTIVNIQNNKQQSVTIIFFVSVWDVLIKICSFHIIILSQTDKTDYAVVSITL